MAPNAITPDDERINILAAEVDVDFEKAKPSLFVSSVPSPRQVHQFWDREPGVVLLATLSCIVLLWFLLLDGSLPVIHFLRSLWVLSFTSSWNLIPASSKDPLAPQPLPVPTAGDTSAIPAIIHQTWYNDTVPAKWQAAVSSCRDMHPGYEYKFWNHTTMEDFVATNYPQMLDTYLTYPNEIQRCDSFRYMALYKYGGFYLDLDVGCVANLDGMRDRAPYILGQTYPWGFSNMFLGAVPNNPYFRELIRSLPETAWRGKAFNYFFVLLSTGSMNISLVWARMKLAGLLPETESGWIIPRTIFVSDHLFNHLPGGSWQGKSDTVFCRFHDFMVWTQTHPSLLWLAIGFMLGSATATTLLILRFSRMNSLQKQE